MPVPHRFINLGTADTGDVAQLLLLGLSPGTSIPPVTGSGDITTGHHGASGTGLQQFGFNRGRVAPRVAPRVEPHRPVAPDTPPVTLGPITSKPARLVSVVFRYATGIGEVQPCVNGLGWAAGQCRRSADGAGIIDDRPAIEEEAFIVGLLLADE